MIVTCPQCQTRFRIPDDKVTAKGVKVRCTRCRHTFRVSRPAEVLPPRSEDPFAQFAPADALSEEDKTPTRGIPGSDVLGVQVEPAGPPPADDFDVDVEAPDTRRSPRPAAPQSWKFAPPPPPREAPSAATPFPMPPPRPEELAEPATPRVSLARIATVRQLSVVRPAGEHGVDDASMAGPPDAPLELDTGSPHSSWQGSTERGFELPSSSDSSEMDFGDLDLEGPSNLPAAASPPPPPASPVRAMLNFDALEAVPAPAPWMPSTPSRSMDAFGDLDVAPTPAPRPPAPALEFGGLDVDPAPAPRPQAQPLGFGQLDQEPAPRPLATTPVPTPAPESRTPTGELFGKSSTPLDEEPFPRGPGGATLDVPDDRAALFDMPAPLRAAAPMAEEPSPSVGAPTSLLADVPDAIPDAPVATPASLPPVPTETLGRVSRPPSGSSVLGLEERRELGAARRVSGAVGNIGVAAVLVVVLAAVGNVYVNEGRLDWGALSPRRWASLFVPPRGIVTLDVSNGLYETHGGRPLAYVRGRVENRGDRSGQVRVRAEIWNGSQLLGASEGLAGVLPSPEELVEASTRRDVEALRARLLQAAPFVAPGKGTDFVLLFDQPPAEVAGLRLKVSAVAVEGR